MYGLGVHIIQAQAQMQYILPLLNMNNLPHRSPGMTSSNGHSYKAAKLQDRFAERMFHGETLTLVAMDTTRYYPPLMIVKNKHCAFKIPPKQYSLKF